MLRRSVDFSNATQPHQRLSPLAGMVASLPRDPSYSLRDSLTDVYEGCRGGSIDINIDELDANVGFCEDFAAGLVGTGGANGLTEQLIATITLYTVEFATATKNFYSALNEALRNQDRNKLRPFVRYLWLLLHALSSCPSAEVDLGVRLVYRGLTGELNSLEYATGNEVVWYQISSCSPELAVQTEFLGDSGKRVLFHIELSTSRARVISSFSAHPEEKEIVLPPNSRFEVTGVLPLQSVRL